MKKLVNMTEPELKRLCDAMGDSLKVVADAFGVESPLFTLLLWNDPKVAQYMSNCERATMIEALKETVKRLENKEDISR